MYRSAVRWPRGRCCVAILPSLSLVRVCKNYEGLVSLRGDVVPGEEVENNLTLQLYLGEGLYEGLLLLRGDMIPREEVKYHLTPQSYLGECLYKGLVSLRGDVVPGEEVENNLTL